MKTKNLFLFVVMMFLEIVLVGCGTEPKIYIADNYDKRSQHAAAEKLTETALSVNKSLAELAEIERASHPHARIPSPMDPDIIGMNQLASIDWHGPIVPLAKKIAEAAKYKLNILGTPPGIPILVSISAKDTPLADILRDAHFQCGNKANIVVYPASKIIELRYVRL
ncbi:MAG: type IVB secretion system lipoprotein DotD [Coxiellaceae bacterium]|jgi:defect-in-organelle-trafficking protein DotD|nr:type IVB secretion system lipoprotein DotD [Coxiellaceae bacterium]